MAELPDPEPVLTGKNISFLELTSERANEIRNLTDAIENPNRTKMVYQRLPRHMQRRAMSHDPKRLPVKARQAFKEQRDITQLKVSKRPSRRHRRRPGNLLLEYNRRQRENLWLETHLWHARRFHMAQRWGFKLPQSATDKGFRAAYRATVHHCLVQDVSYLCHLELRGPESSLLSALSSLGCGGAGSARLLSGRHQGRLLLTSAQTPHRPLSPATLLWEPTEDEGPDRVRRLWIWVHPAGYEAARDELLAVMGLSGEPAEVEVEAAGEARRREVRLKEGEEVMDMQEGDVEGEGDEAMECEDVKTSTATATKTPGKKNVDQIKLEPRRLHVLRRWSNSTTTAPLQLTELKGRMVRFRLSGPGSQAVLQNTLRVASRGQCPSWETAGRLETQKQLWEMLGQATSPGELPGGCVVALTVDDPRRHLPQKRRLAKQRTEDPTDDPITELPPGCETSPLWDESIRRLVTTTKISDNELNRARGRLLVPSATPESLRLPPVPVLLLQNDRTPGWDLLIPPGWGMAFWIALQYSGARAGGLRETERMALETGELRFPAEYPDSAAGRKWEVEERTRLRQEYFKRPPAKRPNFAILGVPDPFSCWWTRLVARLCPGEAACGSETGPGAGTETETEVPSAPLVCRDPTTLRLLSTALSSGTGRPANLQPNSSHLVAVRIRAEGRGVPRPGALLCVPSPEDNPALGSVAGAVTAIKEPAGDDSLAERSGAQRQAESGVAEATGDREEEETQVQAAAAGGEGSPGGRQVSGGEGEEEGGNGGAQSAGWRSAATETADRPRDLRRLLPLGSGRPGLGVRPAGGLAAPAGRRGRAEAALQELGQ